MPKEEVITGPPEAASGQLGGPQWTAGSHHGFVRVGKGGTPSGETSSELQPSRWYAQWAVLLQDPEVPGGSYVRPLGQLWALASTEGCVGA